MTAPPRATATTLALCLAALAPLAACDQPSSQEPRAQATLAAPAPTPDLKDSPAKAAPQPALDPAIAELDPGDARAQLAALQPHSTRARTLRFTDPLLARPEAAEIFAARLARPGVPADERAALAEALPRCGGAWTDALVDAAAVEADEVVRALLIAGLRRAAPERAIPALTLALDDRAPEVRRAAVEVAGWTPAIGDALRPQLRARLDDRSAVVVTEAARALGLLRDAPAFSAIADLLQRGADQELRVEALHALERIDAARALAHPAVQAALVDHDPRVRAAAERLRAAAPADKPVL